MNAAFDGSSNLSGPEDGIRLDLEARALTVMSCTVRSANSKCGVFLYSYCCSSAEKGVRGLLAPGVSPKDYRISLRFSFFPMLLL